MKNPNRDPAFDLVREMEKAQGLRIPYDLSDWHIDPPTVLGDPFPYNSYKPLHLIKKDQREHILIEESARAGENSGIVIRRWGNTRFEEGVETMPLFKSLAVYLLDDLQKLKYIPAVHHFLYELLTYPQTDQIRNISVNHAISFPSNGQERFVSQPNITLNLEASADGGVPKVKWMIPEGSANELGMPENTLYVRNQTDKVTTSEKILLTSYSVNKGRQPERIFKADVLTEGSLEALNERITGAMQFVFAFRNTSSLAMCLQPTIDYFNQVVNFLEADMRVE